MMIDRFDVVPMATEKNNKKVVASPYFQIVTIDLHTDEQHTQHTVMFVAYGIPMLILNKINDQPSFRININQAGWERKTTLKYAARFANYYLTGYQVDRPLKENLQRLLNPAQIIKYDWYNKEWYKVINPIEIMPEEHM